MIDLTGKRFGLLRVVKRVGTHITPNGSKKPLWECVCECGNCLVVRGESLRSGNKKSCGCYEKEQKRLKLTKHGFSQRNQVEPLYKKWINMRNRCNNPNNKDYSHYGGRGITISPEWDNYLSFRKWMLDAGYKQGLTIERIDNNKGYSPQNCKLATMKEQGNNKRNSVFIELGNQKHTIAEWESKLGFKEGTLNGRYHRGWSDEDILTKELVKNRRWHDV